MKRARKGRTPDTAPAPDVISAAWAVGLRTDRDVVAMPQKAGYDKPGRTRYLRGPQMSPELPSRQLGA